MHTLKTHHEFRHPKGKRPGSWAGAKANRFQVERAEKAVRRSLEIRALGVGPR